MTITEVQQETGWGKRGDQWVPPSPLQAHGHGVEDINPDGIWDPGDIKISARTTAAPGWLLADGSLVSRATYPRLFQAIGFSYSPVPGVDPGSGNFYLPNVKGRTIIMRDAADVAFDVLGESGGSKTSTSPHTHSYAHTHGMNAVNTRHAHNVYARNQDTGWSSANHHHNMAHWHLASTSSLLWNGTQTHGHHDRGGSAAEGPWEGANWTGGTSVNVDGTAQAGPNGANATGWMTSDHYHNFNHDHPSTNWNDESPWPGNYNHDHTTNSQSTSTSGDSSVTAANGNLPPYVVFNCFVKL